MNPTDPIVLWQQKWGLTFNVPLYLFLGGLAGGTMTIGALADLLGGRRERFREFARLAAYITIPAIVVGGLSLSFHLGKPERGFAFPLFFTNYQSWLTLGGWVVGAFAPLGVAYALAWYAGWPRSVRRVMAVPAVPLGVAMSLYTGFLLSAAWLVPGDRWYVPVWDRRFVPVLFLLSGFSTGFAACGLAALLSDKLARRPGGGQSHGTGFTAAKGASLADVVALVAEGTWVYYFLSSLARYSVPLLRQSGTTPLEPTLEHRLVGDGGLGSLYAWLSVMFRPPAGRPPGDAELAHSLIVGPHLAYRLLTEGELAPWFWWGFVATGLVAPLLLTVLHLLGERVLHTRATWPLAVKFVLVLVGGLVLRYAMVWAGDLKAPLWFPPSLWTVPTVAAPLLPGAGS